MKHFQRGRGLALLISLASGILLQMPVPGSDPPEPGLDEQRKDLSGFTRFFFLGAGPCIPIGLNDTIRLEIVLTPGGDYLLSISVVERGVLGIEACLQEVLVAGIPCLKETPLPERILTGTEVSEVTSVFSDLTIVRAPEPSCEVRGHYCSYREFLWDSFLTHDPSCYDNHLDEGGLLRVLDLMDRLRRGSEDCNGNQQADALDISGGPSMDADGNGRPDECALKKPFLRGDSNADGGVDISDAILIFGSLFLGGLSPSCDESADVDDSGVLDLSDGIYLLNNRFLGGPEPRAPFPGCGFDTTPALLTCESHSACWE